MRWLSAGERKEGMIEERQILSFTSTTSKSLPSLPPCRKPGADSNAQKARRLGYGASASCETARVQSVGHVEHSNGKHSSSFGYSPFCKLELMWTIKTCC